MVKDHLVLGHPRTDEQADVEEAGCVIVGNEHGEGNPLNCSYGRIPIDHRTLANEQDLGGVRVEAPTELRCNNNTGIGRQVVLLLATNDVVDVNSAVTNAWLEADLMPHF